MTKNEDELERQLRALARSETRAVRRRHRIRRVLERARRQTAHREGLGFLGAFLWVVLAGFGLHLYKAWHTTGAARPARKTETPTRKISSNGGSA